MAKKDLDRAAQKATAGFFSGDAEPAKKIEDKKSEKKVFSFRGNQEDVKAWRLYATVTGTKVDDLGTSAMQEYIENHPLKGAEKALFDEKMNK